MRRYLPFVTFLLLTSCRNKGEVDLLDSADTAPIEAIDADGDGFLSSEECDDGDPNVHPDADEWCDGIDNDCDEIVDEPEAVDALTWFYDGDSDGYGDDYVVTIACEAPAGYVAVGGDCDDSDESYSPSADESDCTDPNDYNCDGFVGYADSDGDGFAACEECDDGDPLVSPEGVEVCDTIDNDCDGIVDEDDALDASTWYADDDGDGFGNIEVFIVSCEAPEGYVEDYTDCDDTSDVSYPDADELCDGEDNDCDEEVDEDAIDALTWYADRDGDGYGDPLSSISTCKQPLGTVADSADCDDTAVAINPSASEVCDAVDNDCDGTIDEDDAIDALTWYADGDGDGYGDPLTSSASCSQLSGTVADSADCDDTDGAINPRASEICDTVDNDCDGTIDEDDAIDALTWYSDSDGDGYGDISISSVSCTQPLGSVADSADCDDSAVAINPGASEVCDTVDNDCDGTVDSTSSCPCSVEYDGDTSHPYMFCTSPTDWNSASSICQSYGYHLVTLDDATENSWVDSTADSYSTSKWHMGYTDQWSEGTWEWVDGSTSTYTNWEAGEPNGGTRESCGQLNRFHPDQTWNDEPCSYSLNYICEYD